MSDIEKEREAFEAWGKKLFYIACFERDEGGSYVGRGLNGAWLGWQARSTLSASPAPSAEVEAVEVKRFDLEWNARRNLSSMNEHAQGDYVFAEDFDRIVAAKNAEIARLTQYVGFEQGCKGRLETEVVELRAQLAAIWEPSAYEYDRALHHNPDAKAWADFFVATFPNLIDKHDLMLGWFANAMMAMHDFLKSKERTAQQAAVPVELTDAQMLRLYENTEEPEREGLSFAAFCRLFRYAEAVYQIGKFTAAPQQGVSVPEALLRRLVQGKPQDHESRAEGAALLREFARLNANRSVQTVREYKVGIYGSAYDSPGEKRAYTYQHQPANGAAYRLGNALCSTHAMRAGDSIDSGLNLLKALQTEGFGVFELDDTDRSAQVATYTTQPGESLMGIALRQLKDESRWVEVRDLNASEHPDMGPHDYYPVGTVLKMPDRSAQGEKP